MSEGVAVRSRKLNRERNFLARLAVWFRGGTHCLANDGIHPDVELGIEIGNLIAEAGRLGKVVVLSLKRAVVFLGGSFQILGCLHSIRSLLTLSFFGFPNGLLQLNAFLRAKRPARRVLGARFFVG